MSLMDAKRIADLKDQIAQSSKKLEEKHTEIRKKITNEVLSEFEKHMIANGFEVSDTPAGKKALYKGLAIELRPETDAYFGCYKAFSLVIAGKIIFVRVLAEFSSAGRSSGFISSSELEKLEKELVNIEAALEKSTLEKYSFEAGVKPTGNQRPQIVKKEKISEVIDHFAS